MRVNEVYIAFLFAVFGIFIVALSIGIIPWKPSFVIGCGLVIVGLGIGGYCFLTRDVKFYLTWCFILTITGLASISWEFINPMFWIGILITILALVLLIPSKR
jgi:hypothetical protein